MPVAMTGKFKPQTEPLKVFTGDANVEASPVNATQETDQAPWESRMPSLGNAIDGVVSGLAENAAVATEAVTAEIVTEHVTDVTELIDPPKVPAAESTVSVDAIATVAWEDEQFYRRLEIIGQIAAQNRLVTELGAELRSAQAEVKELKEELNAQSLVLSKLITDLTDIVEEKPIAKVEQTKAPIALGEQIAVADGMQPVQTDDQVNDQWLKLSTSESLSGIKGLGKKKLEQLHDIAPTLGDIEKLRAQAAIEHKAFHEVLPKGCGEAVAQAIEDRIIEVAKKFENVSVADQIKAQQEQPQADSQAATVVAAELTAQEQLDRVNHFDSRRQAIENRAKENNWTAEDCELDDEDSPAIHAGYEAYNADMACHECPYGDSESQEQWVQGWVLAKLATQFAGKFASNVDLGSFD